MVQDDEVGKSGRTRYAGGKAEMRDGADKGARHCDIASFQYSALKVRARKGRGN